MAYCPLCEKKFATRQGLRGHLNFVHGQGRRTILTEAIRHDIERHKAMKEARSLSFTLSNEQRWREEQKEEPIRTWREEEKEINIKEKKKGLDLGGVGLEW
jgi:hypothetical protein